MYYKCLVMLFLTFTFVYFCFVYGNPHIPRDNEELTCGYQRCVPTAPDKLNVHLIPHSHDDLGWLKTVDKYYFEDVQYVITSVIEALQKYPERRFIQVETAYFYKWWQLQEEEIKEAAKQLINEGRLEIINGGWSMNDEAVTHYQATIDQFTFGHRWLYETFGKCGLSTTGWQIDPFGHSKEQASIYSQMGFDSFFIMRYDYRDKDKRKSERTMDLLWRGSENLGIDSNIFTSTFSRDTYAWPSGFCYDISCGDPNIVEDENSPEYNLEKIVTDFSAVIEEQSNYYPTNNIFITMGDDVHYKGANKNFMNIDKLIKGFKKFNPLVNDKEVNVFYSTPSCYAKAVNDYVIRENYTLDYKTDDFMPLVTGGDGCWTGFYTSRPSSKRYERIANQYLQVTKQIAALAGFPTDTTFNLASAVGIMQHHDAIPGTEKQDVEKDYHKNLAAGIFTAVYDVSKALTKLMNFDVDLHFCPYANISICAETKSDIFRVMLYNPLGRSVTHYTRVPIDDGDWTVTDPEGNSITNNVYDPIRSFQYVADVLGEELSKKELLFKAENIPPLGYKVYDIRRSNSKTNVDTQHVSQRKYKDDENTIGFEKNYVILDEATGFVKTMSINGIELNVTPKIMFYYSDWGSGTYMFKPNVSIRDPIAFTDKVENQITKSDLSVEIRQEMREWGILNIRIYPDTDYIEVDYVAGPIDVGDGQGKDVIIKYITDLETDSIFYTDSNSRELMQRKRNFRPTFTYTNGEPQGANYYPVTSRILLRDENKGVEFAVITDRAQGGSSLKDGELELMLHRATLRDEFDEHLYEIEYGIGLITRGSHYITFGPVNNKEGERSTSYIERDTAIKTFLPPMMFFPQQDLAVKQKSFLNKELPQNVHLLTLEKWNDTDNTYLIRLEHFLEKNDDAQLSAEVTIDIEELFTIFRITSLEERSLQGVVPLDEVNVLQWPQLENYKKDSSVLSRMQRMQRKSTDFTITLAPMQIRTFIATVENI